MPTYLNETAANGYLSSSFSIINKGKERIRIEPQLETLQTSKNFERLNAPTYEPSTYNLVQFSQTSPRLIIISPNKSRVLRLRIRIPENAPNGTYTGKLLIKMLPPETNPLKQHMGNDEKLSINLTPLINTAIPLYISKGTPVAEQVSLSCQQSGNHLSEVVTNQSIWLQQILLHDGSSQQAKLLRLAPMAQYTYQLQGNTQTQIKWQYKSQKEQYTVTCSK